MELLNNFSYLNFLLEDILNNKPFRINELNLTGPRKTGKSRSIELFSWFSMLVKPRIKVIVIRKEATQSVETFNEYLDLYNHLTKYFNSKINHTYKTITLHNNNVLRVISINRNKKSNTPRSDIGVGLSNANCDYLILHFEEAHQFLMDEIRAVEEAVRGYKYMISIRSSNPWSITNEFINYCNINMKYDADILTDNYYSEQFKQKEKKVWHYSRFENNHHLTLQEIDGLNELKALDPLRARISVFGLPGISEGGIYTQYINKIKDLKEAQKRPEYFTGGIDWGITKSDTTASLWGIGYNYSWVAGYGCYEWSNFKKQTHKTTKQMAEEILNFYVDMSKLYPRITTGITIYVDYSAFGTIDLLQHLARERGLYWLSFEPCLKLPISTRIDITTALMSLGAFYLDKRRMEPLLNEMDLSVWDLEHTKDGAPIRTKEADHHLDSMEYALGPFLYELISGYDLFKEELEKKV